MSHKTELILKIANALDGYGYDVYLAKSGEYGFYTNGQRVISFGGFWNFSVDFSGNYKTNRPAQCGTGWSIAKEMGVPSEEEAKRFIEAGAPRWAVGDASWRFTTPEEHLATYGRSSGYTKFISTPEGVS